MTGAAAAPVAAPFHRLALTARDRAEIARIEAYLNSFSTLKAQFQQIADDGAQAQGTAYLSRPGHLRLQYDPPSPLLIVANGTFLIVYDKTVENPSYIPLGSTPAGILVRRHIRLDGKDLAITRIKRNPGAIAVTVVQTNDPGNGSLTLVFSERPLQLRQWRVIDGEAKETTVSLYNVETDLPLNPKLFQFVDPNFQPHF
jgi:outer membrane lipoprotein-sorting protein